MPKTLEIKDAKTVKAEIQYYFSINENARFVRRIDIILMICNGHSINYVAHLFNTNPTTVQRW
ncbi:MAG: helix-turn-helix domain-containing protein, partial [Thermodesulfobacteriota bacterium]|nr:helix-turn-helix domain-containing protein [Thermodesulfobacteriota bacterium]